MNKHSLRREAEETIRKHSGEPRSMESARLERMAHGMIEYMDQTEAGMRELEATMRLQASPNKALGEYVRPTRAQEEDRTAGTNRG